jgi:hypothetical protein
MPTSTSTPYASTIEIQLYHHYFSIPKDRIRLNLSCMKPPKVEPRESLVTGTTWQRSGETRATIRHWYPCWKTPEIPMVWVMRPENMAGLDLPPHVRVFCNMSYPGGNELSGSLSAMVLSLKGAEVPWGHATLA